MSFWGQTLQKVVCLLLIFSYFQAHTSKETFTWEAKWHLVSKNCNKMSLCIPHWQFFLTMTFLNRYFLVLSLNSLFVPIKQKKKSYLYASQGNVECIDICAWIKKILSNEVTFFCQQTTRVAVTEWVGNYGYMEKFSKFISCSSKK